MIIPGFAQYFIKCFFDAVQPLFIITGKAQNMGCKFSLGNIFLSPHLHKCSLCHLLKVFTNLQSHFLVNFSLYKAQPSSNFLSTLSGTYPAFGQSYAPGLSSPGILHFIHETRRVYRNCFHRRTDCQVFSIAIVYCSSFRLMILLLVCLWYALMEFFTFKFW